MEGVNSVETVVYVHADVRNACESGYCLNGASCSILSILYGNQLELVIFAKRNNVKILIWAYHSYDHKVSI